MLLFIKENRMLEKLSDIELLELNQLHSDYDLPSNINRRKDSVEVGYSTKFAYHVVRLSLEAEQILMTQDLDLQKDREILKSVRRGEWTFERLEMWFQDKEKTLETLYTNSTLRNIPDEDAIKNLLLECLEMHYGSLDKVIQKNLSLEGFLNDLSSLVNKYSIHK